MKPGNYLRKNWPQLSIILIFSVAFSLLSLVNHYTFRTSAYDLGIFNHGMYDYSLFRFNKATLILPFADIGNLLADHFTLIHIPFAPLRYVFGSYTLLIVQIVFVLYGGWGVKRYVSLFVNDQLTPYMAQLHFLVSFGVIAALGYDYHDSVIGVCFLPHLLYHAEKSEWKASTLFGILIILCRVEFVMWIFFVYIALALLYRKNRVGVRLYSASALISLLYFIVVIYVIMPILSPEGYTQFNYKAIGDDMKDVLVFALTHPLETLGYMFSNHLGGPIEDFYIKRDFYYAFLLAGGYLMLLRPIFILMLFPIVAQHMLHDSSLKWGISGHYSIETVMILSASIFSALSFIKPIKWRQIVSVFLVLSSGYCTWYFIHNRLPEWMDTTNENIFISWHYRRDFDLEELHRCLDDIPDDAVVSAQSSLVPHLTFRDRIYLYPYIADAEYIALNEKTNIYPSSRESYEYKIEELKSDEVWELIYERNFTYIFRRKDI